MTMALVAVVSSATAKVGDMFPNCGDILPAIPSALKETTVDTLITGAGAATNGIENSKVEHVNTFIKELSADQKKELGEKLKENGFSADEIINLVIAGSAGVQASTALTGNIVFGLCSLNPVVALGALSLGAATFVKDGLITGLFAPKSAMNKGEELLKKGFDWSQADPKIQEIVLDYYNQATDAAEKIPGRDFAQKAAPVATKIAIEMATAAAAKV